MSDGSDYNPHKIQAEPLRRIGAQDLLKVDYTIYGHLRKQGKFRRIFGSTRWSLKFIVVSQGCVYCFNSEHSENPVSAFSLCVYDGVTELDKSLMPHSFEIVPEEKGKPSHVFACETDEKRREWVARIEDVLQQCRQFVGKLSADSGIDEGIGLPHKTASRSKLGPLPSVPGKPALVKTKKYKEAKSEYDLESEEEDEGDGAGAEGGDEYDEVACQAPRARAPSPPTGARTSASLPAKFSAGVKVFPESGPIKRAGTMSSRPPLPIPPPLRDASNATPQPAPPSPKPAPTGYINNSVFSHVDYIFDSSNREEAFGYLQGTEDGTFLVRNARNGPGKVLTVKTPVGTKEFKITELGGKVSLDSKEWFPALSALLTFYNANNLPKSDYSTKLLRGYKAVL